MSLSCMIDLRTKSLLVFAIRPNHVPSSFNNISPPPTSMVISFATSSVILPVALIELPFIPIVSTVNEPPDKLPEDTMDVASN